MDFKTEWEKAKRGLPSALFASDQLYGVPRTRRKTTPTHTPRPYVQKAPAQVWSEYGGHSSQYRYQYSPALAKAQHDSAMAAFTRCEYTLSKLKERW